ncbi:Ldh family oxidoreductase [Planctomyces sp. SH-PL62]|uniref:Ldh family oxidoreductase n=1 Tax=Planctomyces sp. SH-PL62 TaxID=1636152 RepID=UPI00078C8899|nr:Ldh family oxidoreductase [Planctomyces sp. SH-PL62]AMV40594.1 (2R)-3-sulfolactate dehydrogenase (NADP(+)) [Planctomyces sp. SH-PL62]
MDDRVRLSLDEVRELVTAVMSRHGLAPAHVEAVADVMVAGERDGGGSHGIFRVLMCLNSIRAGKVSLDAEPVVRDVAPGVVRVDAGGAFAPLAFRRGLPVLVQKAKAVGLAAMAVNDCCHFAALFPEVEAIARAGLVGFAFTPSHAWVAPAGGSRPLLGTNPIAFGWPRPGRDPFVFDFATSAAARGEIELHRREGTPTPEGWGVDPSGNPTTDADAIMAGAMLPFGGHKGSALSLMVELIAGPLVGDLTSVDSIAYDEGARGAPRGGELLLAIDPSRMLGEAAPEHLARAEAIFEGVVSQGARLPSVRRYEARARSLAEGVLIPRKLVDEVRALLD